MSGDGWAPHVMPAPCRRCTGPGDAHYLTCPTLRLPGFRWLRVRVHLREREEAAEPVTLTEASHRINRRLADAAAAGMTVRETAAAWARREGQP
jgi:hypothetical protein